LDQRTCAGRTAGREVHGGDDDRSLDTSLDLGTFVFDQFHPDTDGALGIASLAADAVRDEMVLIGPSAQTPVRLQLSERQL
jgi:hypothetical protein